MKNLQYYKGNKQVGIATLLILMLVGLAVSAAVFGALRFTQGSQSQTTAFHAQTQAQITAWSGVEVLYEYLKNISASDMTALITAAELATSADPVEVEFDGIPVAGFYKVGDDLYASITGTTAAGTRAESKSTVEVVYHGVAPNPNEPEGGGGDCAPFCSDAPPSVITFNRDLRIEGGIIITPAAGESYQINVKGVMTTAGSVIGVDIINATDSVFLGGANTVLKNIHSNGDIRIDNTITVTESTMALGNICMTNNAILQGLTKANGFVSSNNGRFSIVEALIGQGVSAENSYNGPNTLCHSCQSSDLSSRCTDREIRDASGNLFGVTIQANNAQQPISIKTPGSVANIGAQISSINAQGDLYINYGSVNSGTIGGVVGTCNNLNVNAQKRVTGCQKPAPNNYYGLANTNVSIGNPNVAMSQVSPIEVQTTVFDAYDYKNSANYVFEHDANESKIKVTVRNVEGIDNGAYYLMTYMPGGTFGGTIFHDYLCKEVSGNTCLDEPSLRKTICKTANGLINNVPGRYQNENPCFVYSGGNWEVGGGGTNISIAQGIAWFEGNLKINGDNFYNTFIATGNIETAGGHNNTAPNFAGPNGGTYDHSVNQGTWAQQGSVVFKGICSNAFFPHYPTQLCNAFAANEPLPIANYAYMAGSFSNGIYVGGNITIASGPKIYGSILAGNEFISTGGPTIFGYITALAGGLAVSNHAITAGTKIVVNQLPPTYIPMGGISTGSGPGQGDGSGGGELVCNSPICLAGDAYIATKFSARYQ